MISSAKTGLAEVEQLLIAAKKVRGISLDITAVERDINAATVTITAADSDFAANDFAAAGSKAQNARSMLSGIQRRISEAVQAATRRK